MYDQWDTLPGTCPENNANGGPYDRPNTLFEEVVSRTLCDGQTYNFELYDNYGDGLCCDNGRGKYELFLNGAKIKSGGEFTDTDLTTFTVPSDGDGGDGGDDDDGDDASAPTAAPTSAQCEDSPSWYKKKPKKNCDWVAKRPNKRCKKKDHAWVKASKACPVACDSC